MQSCMSVKENICAYLDNELSAEDRRRFEEHLESCRKCRQELDEMREIIGLCTSLPQQELPEGFREELHGKLLAVADGKKSNVTAMNKSGKLGYIRMISSLAAGLLLIFLTGSLIKYGFFQPGMKAEDRQMTKVSAAEAPALTSGDTLNEGAAGITAADNGAAANADAGLGTVNSNSVEKDEAADAAQGPVSFNKSAAAPDGTEADRSVASKDRSAAAAYVTSMQAAEDVSSKISTITITSDEPDVTLEKIKALSLENNGINSEAPLLKFAKSAPEEQANDSGNASITSTEAAVGPQQISCTIPNANYDKFVSSVNEAFGAANVQSSALVTEDQTESLNEELKQSDKIDAQIKELQQDSTKNADKINELKNQKDELDTRIETMRLNSDFVTVTVFVNRK